MSDDPGVPPNLSSEMTVDDLAREAGVMVSTVRMYQQRGLIAPPTRRGRIGWYGAGHLDRLRAIAAMQERGFSLAAIKELLERATSGGSLDDVLGATGSRWAPEDPVVVPIADLLAQLPGVEWTPAIMTRVVSLGLVDPEVGSGGVTVLSPSLLAVGAQLAQLGVPGDVVLDEFEHLRELIAPIAARFADVFERFIWAGAGPAAGSPLEALDRLAPMAEQVTVLALRHALSLAASDFAARQAISLGVEFR